MKITALMVAGALLASCNTDPSTYPGQCGTRLKGWLGPENGIGELAIWNVVRLSKSGALTWNKQPLSDEKLYQYLSLVSDMEPPPQIILTVEPGASCKRVLELRRLMNRAPICSRDGACGEGTGWKDPGGDRMIS